MSTISTGNNAAAPRLLILARDIKLSHSIFALPFALLATFLAAAHVRRRPDAITLALIVGCMVLARTVAMTINRWADRYLDEHNPRTAGRAVPSGRLSARYMLTVALLCAALFVALNSGFQLHNHNPWPTILSPIILGWLAGYSFTKRFTCLCHLILGSALAISPLAAVVAVAPAYLAQRTPYLLALMVLCWVAGFDIIYALQDVESDLRTEVHSLPARLGVERALWVSRLLHLLSVAALLAILQDSALLGAGFALGVSVVSVLLIVEHTLVWRSGTHHIHVAFFTLNGAISLVLGGLGIWDILRLTPR